MKFRGWSLSHYMLQPCHYQDVITIWFSIGSVVHSKLKCIPLCKHRSVPQQYRHQYHSSRGVGEGAPPPFFHQEDRRGQAALIFMPGNCSDHSHSMSPSSTHCRRSPCWAEDGLCASGRTGTSLTTSTSLTASSPSWALYVVRCPAVTRARPSASS